MLYVNYISILKIHIVWLLLTIVVKKAPGVDKYNNEKKYHENIHTNIRIGILDQL